MGENKTKPTGRSAAQFVAALPDPEQKSDCRALMKMMRKITGKRAVMWGDAIVGFGQYHYRYASGREGDSLITGFSPRKQNISIYVMPGFSSYGKLMSNLGKHKTGKSCLYIKRLKDIDLPTLEELLTRSVDDMRNQYDCS